MSPSQNVSQPIGRTEAYFSTLTSVHSTEHQRRLKDVKMTEEIGFRVRMTEGSPLIYVFVDQNWMDIILILILIRR